MARFGIDGNIYYHFDSASERTKPEGKRDWSALHEKQAFLYHTAVFELDVMYKNGHRTVFDILHHYFLTHSAFCLAGGRVGNKEETFHGLPSIKKVTRLTWPAERFSRELVKKDPLYAFYLHHTYQRYMCDYKFSLGDEGKELARRIINLVPLLKICWFLQYTESDFCRDRSGILRRVAREQTKSLPKEKTTKVHSTVSNGEGMSLLTVPKFRGWQKVLKKSENGYVPEVIFPQLFSTNEVRKIYRTNPVERSYLLSRYKEIFEDAPGERAGLIRMAIQQWPALKKRREFIEHLLQKFNYRIYIRSRILKRGSS